MRLLMYAFLIISTCIKFCVEAYKPFLHLLSSKLGNKDILIHANSLLGIVHSVNKILFRPNEIDKTLISVSMMENKEISKITLKEFFSTSKWIPNKVSSLIGIPSDQNLNIVKENDNSNNSFSENILHVKNLSPYPTFNSKSNKNINLIGYMDFDPKLAASSSYSSRRNGRQISQQPWFHS